MADKIENPEISDAGKNWNVITGCTRFSDGCQNCYAEDIVDWLTGMGNEHYRERGFKVSCREDRLDWPIWKLAKRPMRPARTFVTDMGDPLHDDAPDSFIERVFQTMIQVPQHRFYFLTKRSHRLCELGQRLPWRPWIWAGVTVESADYLHRIDDLLKLPADVNKFLMLEPLLGPIPDLPLEGIDWVVVGGETDKKMRFRPMEEEWVRDIRDQVKAAGLPFMFKHWPGRSHNSTEAILDGKVWAEFPSSILRNVDWS